MARLSELGAHETGGVPVCRTAYGKTSAPSIYYALGLVAAHDLGLTRVVFMFAGGLFVLTAKTTRRADRIVPEAGGSSSFANPARLQRVVSFSPVGTELDYIIRSRSRRSSGPLLGAFFRVDAQYGRSSGMV